MIFSSMFDKHFITIWYSKNLEKLKPIYVTKVSKDQIIHDKDSIVLDKVLHLDSGKEYTFVKMSGEVILNKNVKVERSRYNVLNIYQEKPNLVKIKTPNMFFRQLLLEMEK